MKRKPFYLFLIIEAILLCLLHTMTAYFPAAFTSVTAFPFEQIGLLLQSLSLSGPVGNGLALALWIVLCLLPLLPMIPHIRDLERRLEHAALIAASLFLFPVLYYLANPAKFLNTDQAWLPEMLSVIKSGLGLSIWSVLVCYFTLRLLRMFRQGSKEQLYGYLRSLLYVLCALFVGAFSLSSVGELISGVRQTQSLADTFLVLLRFIASALPYLTDLAVTLCALTLLDELLEDDRSEAVVTTAKKLGNLCCISLTAVTVASVTLNLVQILLAGHLTAISIHVTIPFLSLAFVLAALLLSRLILENKQLADDNDLFI